MTVAPPRENTAGRIAHPEFLRGPDAVRQLIDDPLADRIAKGDPTFGWEGDDRFALYVNYQAGQWELWRREVDEVMRLSVVVPGFVSGVDIVPWVITWIVEHDVRRGFDPVQHVIDESNRHAATQAAQADSFNEEAADRLHHALIRDIGPTEAGMSRRQF